MKFKSIFVTGTDTGVGKTTVSCGIVALLGQRGLKVGVFKPAETGCPLDEQGRLQPQDALALKFFSRSDLGLATICPYALRHALAPAVAADLESVRIDCADIVRRYSDLAAAHDVTLVEGAGGLLVPLTATETFADLAAQLDASVVVVVGSKLGAINHTLLTVAHAQAVGLRLNGYVLNFLSPETDLAASTNLATLAARLGPPIGVVPYLGEVPMTDRRRRQLAETFRTYLRVDELLVTV